MLVNIILKNNYKLFHEGFEGSEDLKYARMVAEYLGTKHHEVVVTEEEMLNFIETDIVQIKVMIQQQFEQVFQC